MKNKNNKNNKTMHENNYHPLTWRLPSRCPCTPPVWCSSLSPALYIPPCIFLLTVLSVFMRSLNLPTLLYSLLSNFSSFFSDLFGFSRLILQSEFHFMLVLLLHMRIILPRSSASNFESLELAWMSHTFLLHPRSSICVIALMFWVDW